MQPVTKSEMLEYTKSLIDLVKPDKWITLMRGVSFYILGNPIYTLFNNDGIIMEGWIYKIEYDPLRDYFNVAINCSEFDKKNPKTDFGSKRIITKLIKSMVPDQKDIKILGSILKQINPNLS